MSDVEAKADVLLRAASTRQAVVDKLLGRSIWNGFVTTMLVPVVANLVFLIVWTGWYRDQPGYAGVALGGALASLLWVSLAVMQVVSRLRALTTVLEKSGVLSRFVEEDRA